MSRGVRYSLSGFAIADDAQVLGELTDSVASTGIQSTRTTQIGTWKHQIALLKRFAHELIERHEAAKGWHLILEYELPRRQKRPDAILLAEDDPGGGIQGRCHVSRCFVPLAGGRLLLELA